MARNGTGKEAMRYRRILFVEALLQTNNKTQSAIAVGVSEKAACAEAIRMCKEPFVIELLAKRRREIIAKTMLTSDNVLANLSRAINFDIRKMFVPLVGEDGKAALDERGKPKMRQLEVWELDDDTALAIQGLEFDEISVGREENRRVIGRTTKLKACDRNVAREQAMKHFGHYEADNKQGKTVVIERIERVIVDASWDVKK